MQQTTTRLSPWYISLIGIFLFIWGFQQAAHLVSLQKIPPCGISDKFFDWTASLHLYFQSHPQIADRFLIACAWLMDLVVLFIFIDALLKKTLRPLISLALFVAFRQLLLTIVSLPVPTGIIWRDPGFLSLFTNFNTTHGLYFSVFVGVGLLGALEAIRLKKKGLAILGFLIVAFEVFKMVVLRIHYTTDIYTAIVTAIVVSHLSFLLTPYLDQYFRKHLRAWLILFILVGVGLYFGSEHLIGKKITPLCKVIDGLHQFSAPINQFFHTHLAMSSADLILSCNLLDLIIIFIAGCTLLGRGCRPALTLLLFIILRQSMQLIVSLPLPEGIIWYDPGFPSLLISYSISNDLYFSAHTGISLIGFFEMMRFGKRWLTILGFCLFLFEVLSVILLRFHYSMDVYTAICTAFCVAWLAEKWAPSVDNFLYQVGHPFQK